jgi:predicted transcriptional regulator of viral defense system
MRLNTVIDKLRRSELAVFTIKDLQKITGKDERILSVYINRMTKMGMINKIEKGKFTIYDDPFIVSTQLIYPSYISFLSAFFLHGKTTQTINEILVVSSRRKKDIDVFGMKIKFITLNPRFMFGFKKVGKGNSYIFLAEVEKAIIDSLFLPRYCPLSEVFSALKEADIDKTLNYASLIGIEAVNRRLGYLLDVLGVETKLRAKGKAAYKLNPAIKSLGRFNSKWRLYINEELV